MIQLVCLNPGMIYWKIVCVCERERKRKRKKRYIGEDGNKSSMFIFLLRNMTSSPSLYERLKNWK